MRRGRLLVIVVVLLLVAITSTTDSAALDLGALVGAAVVAVGGLAVFAYLRRRRR